MENNNPYQIQIGKRITFDLITQIGSVMLFVLIFGIFLSIFMPEEVGKMGFGIYSIIFSFLFIAIVIRVFWCYLYLKLIKFECRKDVLYFSGGIISKFEMNIPYSKIQHAVIYEGFWQRVMGLSSISIETARELGGGVYIPDLDKNDANKLKEFIISKTEKYKSVAGI